MTVPIKIEVTAESPEELRYLLDGLNNQLAQTTPTPMTIKELSRTASTTTVTAVPVVNPKRDTFTVDAPKAVEEAAIPEDADIEPSLAEREADEEDTSKKKAGRPKGAKNKPKDPEPEAVSAPDAKSDKGLSPADALNRAIEILTALYTTGATGQDGVRKLQQKYAVKSFVQMPLDQAHALLADARTLADATNRPPKAVAAAAANNDPVDF
jgi:hypothetical protein